MLFRGVPDDEISMMLDCLGAEQRSFRRGDVIYSCGDCVQSMGMVMSGSVEISSIDFWGNKSVLDRVSPGLVFAETYACLQNEPLQVTVSAAEACEILFLNIGRMFSACPNTCSSHQKLIANMLMISAQKNLKLSRRMLHTSPKTIRGKLISYLSDQAMLNDSNEFDIPFKRQPLADYLGVERSAMSRELGKMRDEGLLQTHKNHFVLSDKFSVE